MIKKIILLVSGIFALLLPLSVTTDFNDLDDTLSGWQNPPCFGSACAGGTGTASNFVQTINNNASNGGVSLDGESMKIGFTGPVLTAGQTTNVLWPKKVGVNNSAVWFSGIYNVYFPNPSLVQAAEYDQFKFDQTHRYMMGSECDNPTFTAGKWRIWNQLTASWVSTTIPCTLFGTANTWHRVQWVTEVDPITSTACSGKPCMHYVALSVDGVTYGPLPNQPSGISGDADNVGIQPQIDETSTGGPVTEYIDEMDFSTANSIPIGTCAGFVLGVCPANIPAGVTNFYFVSAFGSDANDGTCATGAVGCTGVHGPWLHAPGMPAATGVPASITIGPGTGLIFEGGNIYHFGNSALSPYVGGKTWTFSSSGSVGGPIYIGYDPNWYAGAYFTRTIFSGDDAITTNTVTSCTYDYNNINVILLGTDNHIRLDDFEMSGFCFSGVTDPNAGFVNFGGTDAVIENMYFHGMTIQTNLVYDEQVAIHGSGNTYKGDLSNQCIFNVFDNSDGSFGNNGTYPSGKASLEAINNACAVVAFNVFNRVSNGIVGTSTTVHDNLFHDMYEPQGTVHGNIWNSNNDTLVNVGNQSFYNNIFYNINEGVSVWLMPNPIGYIFNNVAWNNSNSANCYVIGGSVGATVYFYNNTSDSPCNLRGLDNHSDPVWNGTVHFANGHYIGYSPGVLSSTYSCDTGATCNWMDDGGNLFQTESIANGQGYLPSNQYSPHTGGSTINNGIVENSICSTFSPDSALCSGTSGGVLEIAGLKGMTATYPAIPLVTRGSVWDIGAYECNNCPAGGGGGGTGGSGGTTISITGTGSTTITVTSTGSLTINTVGTSGSQLPVDLYCPSSNIPTWAATDGPATLPLACYNTDPSNTPATGSVVNVTANSATALQTALTNAACGQQITLPAGSVYSGHFTLPTIVCPLNNYLWIVSSGLSSLPPYGTQVSPCYAGVTSLPGRPTYACPVTPGTYTAKITTPDGSPALNFSANSAGIRIMGLEITRASATGHVGDLITTGNVGLDHIIFDRVLCHGDENEDETTYCLSTSAVTDIAVVNSYMYDFYCISHIGTCTDSHPIQGSSNTLNSTQDHIVKIVNNFLEGSGQSVQMGGGAANTTQADMEFRLNTMFKPLQWNPASAVYNGGISGQPLITKGVFELKNFNRVLYEGNVILNDWGGFTQDGAAFLITPKSQASGSTSLCTTCFVSNVTIRYSTLNSVATIGEFEAVKDDNGGLSSGGSGWSVHDIVADNLQYSTCYGCGTGEMAISEAPSVSSSQKLSNLTFNHITSVMASTASLASIHALGLSGAMITTGNQLSNIFFTNSLFATGTGTLNLIGGGDTTNCAYNMTSGTNMLNACWSPIGFGGNCFVSNGSVSWPGSNVTTVTNYTAVFTSYNSGNGGNYVLSSSSCKGAGLDSLDPGANIPLVNSVIAGNHP